MSLAAFLLALTGVGAPVAAVLGVIGIRRTADDTRAGRWAAVTGVVVGVVGTVVLVAGVIGIGWFRDTVKSVERVDAGECVNVDDADGVTFGVVGCDEPHQAEVVAAGDLDDVTRRDLVSEPPARFCFDLLDDDYRSAARTGRYLVTVVVGAPDPDLPAIGDAFACYFESVDGSRLTAAIEGGDRGDA